MKKNQEISILVTKAVLSRVVLLALALQVTPAQAAPDTYAAAVMADTPIGYWRLGEASVTSPAADKSVSGNNGKYSPTGITLGQPGFHSDGIETAALFDGVNGRIVVPNSDALNPANITMEAKIRWDGPNGLQQRILEKSSFAELAQYGLSIRDDGHVQVELRTSAATSSVDVKSMFPVVQGVETHVVATYDGKVIRIYINGDLDPSETPAVGSISPKPPPAAGSDLGIGNQSIFTPPRDRPFNGLIDEVALFGKALTATQVLTHYQSQSKEAREFQYAVKVVCGKSKGVVVAPGEYFTAINVHNPNERAIDFKWKFAVALPGDRRGPVSKFSNVRLGPDEAFEIDCPDIFQKMETKEGFLKGFAVIESPLDLDVVGVYTAAGATGRVETMEIERVKPRRQGGEDKSNCADFSTKAANTNAGSMFTQTGFTFKQLGPPTPVMSFKEDAGEIGLQFFDAGLEIATTPPVPKSHVTMRLGTFPAAVKLAAYDGATLVYTQTFNTANTYQDFTINTPAPFTRLELKGGNNEAILVRICVN